MGIADLFLGLTGASDPRDKIASAMAYQRNPNPMTQAAWSKASGQPAGQTPQPPGPGGPAPAPTPGGDAGGDPSQQGQQPAAPPQPQAYTSPPDMVALYTELAKRGQAEAGFDRGIGMMASALDSRHPQGQQDITNTMNAQASADQTAFGPEFMKGAQDASDQMQTAQTHSDLRASLPGLAKQPGMPSLQELQAMTDQQIGQLIQKNAEPTTLQKEYQEYVKDQAASGQKAVDLDTFRRTISTSAQTARVKYGLNVKWAPTGEIDPKTGLETYMSVQLADDGSAPKAATYNGKPISQPAKVVETPTGVDIMTPDGSEIIRHIDKDNNKAEYDKIMGQKRGEATSNLPLSEFRTEQGQQYISNILNSKDVSDTDYDNVAGNWDGIVAGKWANLAGWKGTNDIARTIQALNADNMAQQYQTLARTGPVSDNEGKVVAAFGQLAHPELMTGAQIKEALYTVFNGMTEVQQMRQRMAGQTGDYTSKYTIPPQHAGQKAEVAEGKYQTFDNGETYQSVNGRLVFVGKKGAK